MHKRIVIGLIVLIFVLGVAIVFYHQYTDIQQYKQELADAKELEKHLNQQPAADNKPPGEAKEGHKWEWHGDHWHEMPAAQSDVPQQTPILDDANGVTQKSVKTSQPNWRLPRDESLMTDEEINRYRINEIASLPEYAEIYKIMTENEYPYSDEVQSQITAAYKRKWAKDEEHSAKLREQRRKLAEYFEKEMPGEIRIITNTEEE